MSSAPCPILIVSSKARESDISLSLVATRAGALLVLPKPEGPLSPSYEGERRHLISMVKALSRVKVVRRRGSKERESTLRAGRREIVNTVASRRQASSPRRAASLVAIGSSTGGPAALRDMVLELPRDFHAPILVVQHIARGFVNLTTHFLPGRTRFGHPGNPEGVGVGSPPFGCVLLVWRRI